MLDESLYDVLDWLEEVQRAIGACLECDGRIKTDHDDIVEDLESLQELVDSRYESVRERIGEAENAEHQEWTEGYKGDLLW